MINTKEKMTQAQFGKLVGITQQAVSEKVKAKIIDLDKPASDCLLKYCDHIREQAAGRSLDLTAERARLSAEQADRVALKNAVSRKEFSPRSVIVKTMANVSRQIVGILEAIPVKLKREAKLKPNQLKIVEREIIKARNVATDVRPDWGQPDEA